MDIKVIIEHSTDGMYYCTPEDNKVLKTGLIGCGKTVEEAKEDFFTCYEEAKEMYGEKKNISFDFAYDTTSFLQLFSKKLSITGLETITGINRKQLNHYLTGHRHPKPSTVKKIAKGIREFQEELSHLSFV